MLKLLKLVTEKYRIFSSTKLDNGLLIFGFIQKKFFSDIDWQHQHLQWSREYLATDNSRIKSSYLSVQSIWSNGLFASRIGWLPMDR